MKYLVEPNVLSFLLIRKCLVLRYSMNLLGESHLSSCFMNLPSFKDQQKRWDWGHYTTIAILYSNFSLNQNCFFAAYDNRPSTKSLTFLRRWYVSASISFDILSAKTLLPLLGLYLQHQNLVPEERDKITTCDATSLCYFLLSLLSNLFCLCIHNNKKCHGSWLLQSFQVIVFLLTVLWLKVCKRR